MLSLLEAYLSHIQTRAAGGREGDWLTVFLFVLLGPFALWRRLRPATRRWRRP
jgi:hypothetical protein